LDALSLWFILLANLIAFAAALSVAGHANEGGRTSILNQPAFFLASLNGFYFAMLLVPILDNLVGLWIGIELTTLASALVVGYRNTPPAWEAAWKYLIITSAGIVLALLGTVFLAHAIPPDLSPEQVTVNGHKLTDRDALMNWTSLIKLAQGGIPDAHIDQRFVILAFLFALVGYGTKAGLAPMHTWLPDGHGEAPPAISALLSGVLIKLALYAILRFYTITNAAHGSTALTSALLLGAGVLSLVIATPFILKRNRFKRVLAYHSVEHMGIICVGIGIGAKLALAGALLHTLNHAITKALMFLAYGNVYRQYDAAVNRKGKKDEMKKKRELKDEEITGIVRTMPITAAFVALAGLALVGTPPFSIFVSELMILWGALERFFHRGTVSAPIAGLPDWAVVVGIVLFMLTTTLIFFGLVRHLSDHLLGTAPPGVNKGSVRERWLYNVGPLAVLALGILPLLLFVPDLIALLDRCVQILSLPEAKGQL
jgi:hydrogenase-4 component F